MSWFSRFRRNPEAAVEVQERDAFLDHFLFNGQAHSLYLSEPPTTLPGSPAEDAPNNFVQTVRMMHRRNGVVSAAVTARALIMSQLRFQWRSEIDGTTFGNRSLETLERPSLGMSREQLLWRIEQDVSYAGNAYVRRMENGELRRLRPDWVKIAMGSDESPDDVARGADVQPIAYVYQPSPTGPAQAFGLNEVAHIAPEPDPVAHFRGESWVSSVVREVLIDLQATDHLEKYFANATTANMIIKAPPNLTDPVKFNEWVDAMDRTIGAGSRDWRNVYLGGGSDAMVVGANLAELDMKNLQGGLETRISTRSRVHPVILGAREGLQGSSLNSGNYNSIRRLWADAWFNGYAPSWCSSLERIIPRPSAAELTFDPSRIPFLQEDMKDAADISSANATALQALDAAGFDMDAAVAAIATGDLTKLIGAHDGNQSVQRLPEVTQ